MIGWNVILTSCFHFVQPRRLCAFQSADYAVSISKNGRRVASLPGTYIGNQQMLNVNFTDLNVQLKQQEEAYEATVAISSPYGKGQATVNCIFIGMFWEICYHILRSCMTSHLEYSCECVWHCQLRTVALSIVVLAACMGPWASWPHITCTL